MRLFSSLMQNGSSVVFLIRCGIKGMQFKGNVAVYKVLNIEKRHNYAS